MSTFTTELDGAIDQFALLKHPFYQAWNNGTLTMPALQEYAKQYYQFERAFPTFVSQVHANTTDTTARKHLLENLIEEERGEVNHPELWLRFSDALGLNRDEVKNATLMPETEALIGTMRDLTRNGDSLEGLSALYGYESQIPEVAITKIDGLTKHYAITDDRALSFFKVHAEVDQWHRASEQEMIEAAATTEADQTRAKQAAAASAKAMYDMLSGITTRFGISCN